METPKGSYNPLFLFKGFKALLEWKRALGLPNPGTFETLHKEVRGVSPSTILFDGAKADIAKGLSPNFQVSHSFNLGSIAAPQSYSFGSIFVAGSHLMHALVDCAGTVQGKYMWSSTSLVSDSKTESNEKGNQANEKVLPGSIKTQIQTHLSPTPGHSMLQLEADYTGSDYSFNTKAINADPSDGGSGIYTASLLQALSQNISAGFELIAQKPSRLEPIETGFSFATRYFVPEKCAFALTLQQLVALHASYFHRVSPQVELGTELQALFVGPRRDISATVAAKFDYRQACVKTQADTMGRISMVYEERIFPGFSLLLSGELDHIRAASRFGFGINLEN